MFYLAAATLASRTGGAQKPSVVTRLRVAIGVNTGGVNALHSGVFSSCLKRKRTDVAKPGALTKL